jgi:dTDP-glucose pyrophosphorylase/CBS domain-containing protein
MSDSDRHDRLRKVIVSPETPISEALSILDQAGTGMLLVCGESGILEGVITDGDIRRALLRKTSLAAACAAIANKHPVVAKGRPTPAEALQRMNTSRDFLLNHLPVVDENGRPVDLILRSDLVAEDKLPLSALIMAGGKGTRLGHLTKNLPKPMLPVGGRPLLELIIGQLQRAGIKRVSIATHYLGDKIKEHFRDGQPQGLDLQFINEEKPLGTAGALGLLAKSAEPLLVINGDIFSGVDFRAMLAYHQEHKAELTVAVCRYDFKVPYGVIDLKGTRVSKVEEKPSLSFFVNAGIYLMEPSVLDRVPRGRRLEMTDLIQYMLKEGVSVVGFPVLEYWLDVGQMADFEKAQQFWAENGQN